MISISACPPASDDAIDLMKRIIAWARKTGVVEVSFEPGDVILQELDKSTSLFVLVEGEVDILAGPELERIVTLTQGDIVGELSFIDNLPHTATAVAKTRTVLLMLNRSAFSELSADAPELAYEFNQHLLRTVVSRLRNFIDLQRSHKRQAAQLKQLSDELKDVNLDLAAALERTQATQTELIAASRLATVGQLAAGMAHELNSPVAAMLRTTEQLESDFRNFLISLPGLSDGSGDEPDKTEILPELARIFETGLQPDIRPLSEVRKTRRALEDEILTRHPSLDRTRLALLTRLAGAQDGSGIVDAVQATSNSGVEAAATMLELAEAVRSLAICAKRVDHVVRALQRYSRVDEEQTAPTDIREGIHETLALFSHEFKSGIVLKTDLQEVPEVQGRPAELNQVWTNLIQNAVQAMDATGTLTIHTSSGDGGVQARFHDTGCGIPRENLERIYDLNFSTRRGFQRFGFGVGLSVAKTIIEAHSGRITVDSEPGNTTFVIWLPFACPNRD